MPSRRRREARLTDFFRTRNASLRALLQTVGKVLDHDVAVLILGESGTGKDRLAAAIHACGARRERPLVAIDCASIPHDIFESELFGHEKGTFTDAQSRKIGKLEQARGGTVYFDELSALTPSMQAKLLRAIQEKRFTRLGGHEVVEFDARVLSSSSGDPESLIASGALRRDLFYRLNVVTLQLPPLRDRREDIPQLAKELLRETGRKLAIGDDAMQLLVSHAWPGNIRELRNAIERAALLENGTAITPASLPLAAPADIVTTATRDRWTLDQLEARYIGEVLRQTRSNYSRAAEILGINRKTLLEKRRKYGLE